MMIRCPKCDNDTRTSQLVSAHGVVMLDGTLGTDPQPVIAQVCTACGFIELYAPIPIAQERQAVEPEELREIPSFDPALAPVQAAMQTSIDKF
jgi:predicted nucleic-acid-binding Zn-ribbon protein